MQENLPITVILVTDADTVDALIGLAHIPENPVGGVLYASGLVAHKSMYGLGGTYGAGGSYSQQYPFALTDWATLRPSALHPVSSDGISGPALKAYTGIISGVPEALSALIPLSKKTGANAEQAKVLMDRTEAWLLQRYTAWESKSASMDAYMEGRALGEWLKVAPSMKDQNKVLVDRLKLWAKADLKTELTAYGAYTTLGPMAFSAKKTEKDQARSGLDQVIAKLGDTVYGRQCSVLRQAMDVPEQ